MIDKMTSKLKRWKLLIVTLLIVGIVSIYFFSGSQDVSELIPLADTSPCNARITDDLETNLHKIDSYRLSEAKLYLKKLLPENFKFQDASFYLNSDNFDQSQPSRPPHVTADQSLPSIPALVTASSANHFSESMELVENINSEVRAVYKDIKFFFYDMGLKPHQRKKLAERCNCEVITFPFKDFPGHISIMKGYAWKPLAIQLALKKHRFVMWMDASVRFYTRNLNWAFKHAQSLGVSASLGFAPIAARTQRETFNILDESPCAFKDTNEFEATFIIIYATDFIMQYFLIPWVSCALSNGCMVPKISPEKYLNCYNDKYYFSCHRFDQSILSILMTRIFHQDLKAHVMVHTFYKICKGGFDLPYLPDSINKIVTRYMRSCF